MENAERTRRGWSDQIARMTDAELLSAELSHRVRNEVAASIAALHLAVLRPTEESRELMIRTALRRLEGFGEVLKTLGVPPGEEVELETSVEAMCRGVWDGRHGLEEAILVISVSGVRVPSALAHRLLMVAYELLHNAIRHAVDGGRGMVAVIVRAGIEGVRLAVVDDGPSPSHMKGGDGTGMGSSIVREIVRRGGGQIVSSTDGAGTCVEVNIPVPRGFRTEDC